MTTFSREELQLYVMGEHDDPAAVEAALATDEVARAYVAEEARLEALLRDAAAAATFCPGCGEATSAARCDACGAAIAPGGYLVERVLVAGAHGRMYVARDADGRQVALKELAFVHSPTLEVIAAFEREARFLRALHHPAIPRFVASFEEGSGVHVRYYLAQELVAGEPLDARLAEHWYAEAEIVDLARQVLRVLVYLQAVSPMVIHRDIKPANLLRRPDGTIAVVDFGAAHVQGTTAGSTSTGTFGYMPIEQLAGIVDATTDPYALGASLVHLLTRREPWRILQSQGASLGELNVSPALRAFLTRLVAPDSRDRYPTAAAALAALDRIEKGQPDMDISERPAWRRPLLLAAASLALIASGVGGYTLLRSDDPAAPPADPVERELARMIETTDAACSCAVGDRACGQQAMDAINRAGAAPATGVPDPGQEKRIREILMRRVECLGRAMAPPAVLRIELPRGVTGELWIDGEEVSAAPIASGHEQPIAAGKRSIAVLGPGGTRCERELELSGGETTTFACTPTVPAPAPSAVPPSVLEGYRETGRRQIVPDEATRAAIAEAGPRRLVGAFKLCLDATGAVTTIDSLKSTGLPAYDEQIEREMRAWRFRPPAADGEPAPICTVFTFTHGDPPRP